jgi:hypothetical protein
MLEDTQKTYFIKTVAIFAFYIRNSFVGIHNITSLHTYKPTRFKMKENAIEEGTFRSRESDVTNTDGALVEPRNQTTDETST